MCSSNETLCAKKLKETDIEVQVSQVLFLIIIFSYFTWSFSIFRYIILTPHYIIIADSDCSVFIGY